MKIEMTIGFECGITGNLGKHCEVVEIKDSELFGKNDAEKERYIYDKYVIPFRNKHHLSMSYKKNE